MADQMILTYPLPPRSAVSCGWARSGTCSDMDFLSCTDGVQAFQCVALAAGVSPSYCEGRCSGNATKPCVGKGLF